MKFVVPVAKGGTGATTPSAAVLNLGGVDIDQLNQPNGVAMVGPDGKLFAESIPSSAGGGATVLGASQLSVNQSSTYEITNFDSNTVYTVVAVKGVAVLNGSTITYVAGPTAGTGGFSINGKSFAVSLIGNQSIRPTILTPSNGATNQSSSVTFDSSAFNANGWNDTHQSSDWQLSTSSTFNPLVTSVTASTTNKTSWTVSGLLVNSIYYVRVRHKGTNYNYSDWSLSTSFTTKAVFLPISEEAIVSASDKVNNQMLGYSIAISADGTRVVVGVPYSTVGANDYCGAAYVYVRSGTTWTQEAKLIDVDRFNSAQMAASVAISGDGTRIVLSSNLSSPGGVYRAGVAIVYVRSGSTWSQEASVSATVKTAHAQLGNSVSLNTDGTRLLVGAVSDTTGVDAQTGAAYVFVRSGVTWTQEAKLVTSDAGLADSVGSAVALSGDGLTAIVGAEFCTVAGISNAGGAYIFTRTNTTWTQQTKLVASDPSGNAIYGFSVAITGDGSRVVVGAKQAAQGGIPTVGAAYVHVRVANVWSLETKLVQAVLVGGDQFGFGVDISDNGAAVVVGCPYSDTGTTLDAGSASVFARTASTWNLTARLVASSFGADHTFGYSVAIAKNISRIAVGAPQAEPGGLIAPGAAYIFS